MSRRGRDEKTESWWELWPGLLRSEFEAFNSRSIEPRILRKSKGLLIIEVDWPVTDQTEPIHLQIGFSPFHPFFRPAVGAPDMELERHQNPLTRELCLLTQETGQWDSRQPVADLIEKQLERLMAALQARQEERWEDAAALEEQTPDPLMPYFEGLSEDGSVILFDGQDPAPTEKYGLMELVVRARSEKGLGGPFEAVLHRVKDTQGRLIGKTFKLPALHPSEQKITARWVRLTPPATTNPEELLALAEKTLEEQTILQPKAREMMTASPTAPFAVTGIVFPEEVEYGPEKTGSGWLFLVNRRTTDGKLITRFARGERSSKADVFSRLPVSNALERKKVLLVGCGAIGSFAGLELARAGVGEITFFDDDVVKPGNSLRWPFGRESWGCSKAATLARFVNTNYPWTKAFSCNGRLGATESNPDRVGDLKGTPGPFAQLLEMIREADIVVDTSASLEVQHALSDHCRRLNTPYVMGNATHGVAGGIVARLLPGMDSCWVCLHEHWKDGSLPKPAEDNTGAVTPVGCNAPTFTGGGFDLQEVSLEVVRSTIGLLSGDSYDPGDWAVSILTLRDENGRRILPNWEALSLPHHSRCICEAA